MSKDWDYAKLAKEASEAGGPDEYLNKIKENAYNEGVTDSEQANVWSNIICRLACLAVGSLATLGIQKIWKDHENKKKKRIKEKSEAVEAEEIIKDELKSIIAEMEEDVKDTQCTLKDINDGDEVD